jgi:hypothetical protein
MKSKFIIILGTFLMLFVCIVGWIYLAHIKEYPRIKISSQNINFGSSDQDQVLNFEVGVTNIGKKTLRIINVQSDCGCTATRSNFYELKPGVSGLLYIQLNTGEENGTITKRIQITSNDPINKLLVISIRGIIKPTILVSPNKIDFGEVMNKSISRKKVDVLVKTKDPVEVDQVISEDSSIDTYLRKINDKFYRVELKINPSIVRERYRTRIHIKTTLKERSDIIIPVTAKITGDIKSKPSAIFMKAQGPDIPLEKSILLFSESSRAFKILSIKSTNPEEILVSSELNKLRSKHNIKLEIIADSGLVKKVSGEVTVFTDSKEQPEITLPVYAIIQ